VELKYASIIDQYKAAYPNAKLIAPVGAIEALESSGKKLEFDGGTEIFASTEPPSYQIAQPGDAIHRQLNTVLKKR